jgi:2-polyprenyl-6-methoxyphenol hydroxylase-like FAD-dependent oxidoreductase
MAAVRNVLIVGGGIAGMSLAISLSRVGIRSEIHELRTVWSALGTGISLQGPALRALRTMGVLDQCIERGFGYSKLVNCDAAGHIVAEVDLPRLLGPNYPATFGVMREALHSVLKEELDRTHTPVRLGSTIKAYSLDAESVGVEFTDGAQGRYDLLVGADGANSIVREMLFGPEHRPRYMGQVTWRATVRRPPEVQARYSYYGPRNKSGFNPVSAKHMYIYLVQNTREQPRWKAEQLPEVMREQLEDFGGLLGAARAEIIDPEQVLCRPVTSSLLPAPWYVGRAIVIGDAAHTTTPHLASGAGIAIEDGVVLAEALSLDRPIEAALNSFMQRRFERCRMVVENCDQLSDWERAANVPEVQHAALIGKSFNALAQPI